MSIALRFIPTLMDELDKIILAQKSRGSEIRLIHQLFERQK
jgi:energy-coupling factor transport system permease protein